MNVLITGANRFVGKNLTQRLYTLREMCIRDRYWTHGLMPEGYYNFDSAGRMILDSETE